MPSVAASRLVQQAEIIGVDTIPQTAPEGIHKSSVTNGLHPAPEGNTKIQNYLLIFKNIRKTSPII
jgi:hypothetical protein